MNPSPGSAAGNALDQLAAVSLEELDSLAALHRRRDLKYIVPASILDEFVGELPRDVRALDINRRRAFSYASTYFDTPGHWSYLAAARSRPCRHKVRIRHYADVDTRALEVKERDRRGETIKHRMAYDGPGNMLSVGDRSFIDDHVGGDPGAASLVPTLTTSYLRTTILIGTDTRVTIDTGLRCATPDMQTVALTDHAVLETKSERGSTPVDRLLWARGHRPVKISKYCVGLALLHPELAANKWTRTLGRYFGRAISIRT